MLRINSAKNPGSSESINCGDPSFAISEMTWAGLFHQPAKKSGNPLNTLIDKLLRPTWVEISVSKLRRNFERIRRLAGPRKVMAVIKADAYGHGAVAVAHCLAECGVDWFGLATVEEALELRAAGIKHPILLLGGLYMSDPADLIEYQITPSVSSTARLGTYAECARRYGRQIEFHLKVDTGLGRLGVPPDRLTAFLEHYRTLDGVRLTGLFTHLASAEDLVGHQTEEQGRRFPGRARAIEFRRHRRPSGGTSRTAPRCSRGTSFRKIWSVWEACFTGIACRSLRRRA